MTIATLKPYTDDAILELSHGEVKKPDTLSFRTKLPIKDGLMCQSIFGPIYSYQCECKVLTGIKHKGKICSHCGVEVISNNVRSERFGHIELRVPVLNPFGTKSLSLCTGLSTAVIADIVLRGTLRASIVEDEHGWYIDKNGREVAIVTESCEDDNRSSSYELFHTLSEIDWDASYERNKNPHLLEYKMKGFTPTDFFMTKFPVNPPAYRPIVKLAFGYSDSPRNEMYSRVIGRSLRIASILQFDDTGEFINFETLMIQKAINSLVFGGMRDSNGKEIPGVMDSFGGKGGLLRGNLLGKRVDYSGRTVIHSGPYLKLGQIGIPRKMAYELFKPFILNDMLNTSAYKYSEALDMYERKHPSALKSLENVVAWKGIGMNRQPSLHRYNFGGYPDIVLHDGKAIHVHPMVCTQYNADFDGDQVMVTPPLTKQADRELEDVYNVKNNVINSMDSQPLIAPSHEMVIGLYNMTRIMGDKPVRASKDMIELERLHSTINDATHRPYLQIYDRIMFYYPDGRKKETCYGRLLLEKVWKMDIDEAIGKSEIRNIISRKYDEFDRQEMADALDATMQYSFRYTTDMAMSVCLDDIKIPSTKAEKFAKAEAYSRELEDGVKSGKYTEQYKYENNIRTWMHTIEDLQKDFIKESGEENPIVLMWRTGARVNMQQISQLSCAKGMMTGMGGRVIEYPVRKSLVEGLDTFSYFTTCSGSRKSLSDKFFMTPKAGYLARKLVTAGRDLMIMEEDCGTTDTIEIRRDRAQYKYAENGVDVYLPNSKDTSYVKVRSPITCRSKSGICSTCYGLDPSTRKRAKLGSHIGTIAGQSCSEPSTQMTMRTFHTSGAATIRDSKNIIKAHKGGTVSLETLGGLIKIKVDELTYYACSSATMLVEEGQVVPEGEILCVYLANSMNSEDITGSLPRIEKLYELRSPDNPAIIATESGKIELNFNQGNGEIEVYIDNRFQGASKKVPVQVYNGMYVDAGTYLTPGEPNVIDVFNRSKGNYALAGKVFLEALMNIYYENGLKIVAHHPETMFRAFTDITIGENGESGLRSRGSTDPIKISGAISFGSNYPSWLKSVGFGYVKKTMMDAVTTQSPTLDVVTERIMMGGDIGYSDVIAKRADSH